MTKMSPLKISPIQHYLVIVFLYGNILMYLPSIEQAPFIRFPPRDLTVQPGGMIRLQCYTMGNPYPNVTWFKDGVPINTKLKPYIKILKNYTLIVKRPQHNNRRKDGGKYSCVAVNRVGVYRSKNATVIVPCKSSLRFLSNQRWNQKSN